MFIDWQNIYPALESLSKRLEDDQVQRFTNHENVIQRSLAIAASVISIFFCLLAIYSFLAIDPKRLVFRHQLLAFLILFDLLKAIVLLIFPSRVFSHPRSYFSKSFCEVIGFFTATCIEGADMAILAFAIHTFLLIFKPSFTVKIPNSDRVEGGLYRYRYYVYGLSLVIPLTLASFPYIGVGYVSFVCWCYLPQKPVWYRLVLSWIPRYCIVVVILSIYGLIYYHVLREFRTLGGVFSTMHRLRNKNALHPTSLMAKPSFFSALVFFFETVRDHILPKLVLPGENGGVANSESSSDSNIDSIVIESFDSRGQEINSGSVDAENAVGTDAFQAANLDHFRRRQKVIEKQMKSIFVYPFAYILMWLFPFILQCTQINYESRHSPIVWLNCVGAFMQPFYGFVDSMVFFYREKPWRHTTMQNYTKQYDAELEALHLRTSSYGDTDSTVTASGVTKTANVDLSQYSRWRKILCMLRFPLMQLPTERNIAKLRETYPTRWKRRLHRHATRATLSAVAVEPSTNFNDLQGKHDFSNLLQDSTDEDFRLSFSKYATSFPNDTACASTSNASNSASTAPYSGGRHPSVASTSNRSNKSRRYSVINDAEPIPEDQTYIPNSGKPRAGTMINGRKSLQRAYSGNDSTLGSADTDGNDMELDLFEFLQKGPT